MQYARGLRRKICQPAPGFFYWKFDLGGSTPTDRGSFAKEKIGRPALANLPARTAYSGEVWR